MAGFARYTRSVNMRRHERLRGRCALPWLESLNVRLLGPTPAAHPVWVLIMHAHLQYRLTQYRYVQTLLKNGETVLILHLQEQSSWTLMPWNRNVSNYSFPRSFLEEIEQKMFIRNYSQFQRYAFTQTKAARKELAHIGTVPLSSKHLFVFLAYVLRDRCGDVSSAFARYFMVLNQMRQHCKKKRNSLFKSTHQLRCPLKSGTGH